jgi:Tol biopolymer transport system component
VLSATARSGQRTTRPGWGSRLARPGLALVVGVVIAATGNSPAGADVPSAGAGPSSSAAVQSCAGRGTAHANGRIVVRVSKSLGYPTPGEKLFSVRPDGSGRRVLTRPKRAEADLTVEPAPDGRHVAIARFMHGSFMKIVDLKTGRVKSLLPAARVIPTAPVAWSPSGKLLAFTANPEPPVPALRLVHPDGSSPHDLTSALAQARWSRNGRCLVGYTPAGVGVISASGGAMQSFSRPFPTVFGLTFSPNGQRLIFHAAAGERPTDRAAIYSSGLGGEHIRKLVGRTRTATDPVIVSPDGRWIAYADARGTLMRPVGGGPARRLLHGLYIMAWAPAP